MHQNQQKQSRQPAHRQLKEGLREHDLRETILKEISVDLFDPKAGNEEDVIVVALECVDENPAKDLEEFIRTGPIDTIDSDVSPGPNEDGHYMDFAEFERNNQFPVNFVKLLNDIKHVVKNNEWKFKSYPNKNLVDLTPESLLQEVVTDPVEYQTAREMHNSQNAAESFLTKDLSRSHYISEGKLFISTGQGRYVSYLIDSVDTEANIYEAKQLRNKPIRFDNARVLRLQKMFGPSYNVNNVDEYIVVTNSHGNAMALKPVATAQAG